MKMKKVLIAAAAAIICATLLVTAIVIEKSSETKPVTIITNGENIAAQIDGFNDESSESENTEGDLEAVTQKHVNAASTSKSSKRKSSKSKRYKSNKKRRSSKSGSRKQEKSTIAANFPLDLNSATKDELMQIDGIGEATADKIIGKRTELGGFKNMDQLLDIDGIGEGTVQNLRQYAYIENEQPLNGQAVAGISQDSAGGEANQNEEGTVPIISWHDHEENPVSEAETESDWMLDLNTAEFEDFMLIPGMTEEIADEILNVRDEIGRYSDVHELLMVDGMTNDFWKIVIEYVEIRG